MTSERVFEESVIRCSAAEALDHLHGQEEEVLDLLEAWTKGQNAAALQEAAYHATGKIKTAARRALAVLKSRGVEAPARVKGANHQASTGGAEARLLTADASGTSLLLFIDRLPDGSYNTCFFFFREGAGIAGLQTGKRGLAKLKQALREATGQSVEATVPVPVDWARQRVAAVRRTHRARGGIEPLGFDQAASLLEPVPTETLPHPFDEEGFELSPQDAATLAINSGKLHQLREFQAWLPAPEAMREFLTELGARIGAGERPAPEALNEHLKAEILNATDRYFTPDVREVLVTRLKDAALGVLAREGEQRALELAATITVVEQAGLVTDPPRDIPFLTAFFEKAVSLMLAQGNGQLRIPVPKPSASSASTAQPTDSGTSQ